MIIHVLEVHDFSPPKSSDSEGSRSTSSSDNGNDGYRGYRLAGNEDEEGNQLPFLPQHDGSAW
jgi:hypothetical protein